MSFQIGAALLDACVLAILSKEDVYGYILAQQLKDVISISESTLYPVLRRLQNEACLTAYDKPVSGRNRRYYRITRHGTAKLDEYIHEWGEYKKKVDNIFGGNYEQA